MAENTGDYLLQKEAELRRLNQQLEAQFEESDNFDFDLPAASYADEPRREVFEVPAEEVQPCEAEGTRILELEDQLAEAKSVIKFQKARIQALQDELSEAASTINDQAEAIDKLKGDTRSQTEDSKKHSQQVAVLTQQLEKAKKQSAEAHAKNEQLEKTTAELHSEVSRLRNLEKKASKEVNNKDVRMNRLIEEVERYKQQVKDLRSHDTELNDKSKKEIERLQQETRRLERQKAELLAAFKKQLKLIDILKRQKMHVEAARLLGFTEEEFMKTLDLGDKL